MGGNTKGRRRRFGAVRRLASGRWQARYLGPDGLMRPADCTFASKTEAERWLVRVEGEIVNAEWIDPDAGKVPFADYAAAWIGERPNLRPKTLQLYGYLLRCHLRPALGEFAVKSIGDAKVRRWRKELLDAGVSPVTAAKVYRLLKAILNTAVDDGLIRRNPCRIKGAGQEKSPERPIITSLQVWQIADAIDPRYRALVLLAGFGSLRWGELAALRRCDVDLEAGAVRITRQLSEVSGRLAFGPPKSAAGRRVVHFPAVIAPELRWHLGRFAQSGDNGLVFTSPAGRPLRHSQFRSRVWVPTLAKLGLTDVHFHDLRHAGNDLAAASGATLRELMARMGHSTTRAALIYLHDSDDRQRKIAESLDALLREQLASGSPADERGGGPSQSGTNLAQAGEQE
jgi:integrase